MDFEEKPYGKDPSGPLLEMVDGYLYGVTGQGGLHEGGLIYKMKHDGSDFTIVHYFDNIASGMNPYSGLGEANGFLYGTTVNGGFNNHGTIYRIKPDGSGFAKLHDFNVSNGAKPSGEVIAVDNVLYGMTTKGGGSDQGAVYRMNPDGSGFTVLHEFTGPDGSTPARALVFDGDGTLYGMTNRGGLNDLGVLFKIETGGAGFAKLFDFSGESGGNPDGSLLIREDTFSPASAAAQTLQSEDANLSVSIHPNPATDSFNVLVETPGGGPINFVVSDQYGQSITRYEVTPGTPMEIGRELKRGIYIMKAVQGNVIIMQRLVKK
jgi:uncharacterized repeat protein (TIGR03803 family)